MGSAPPTARQRRNLSTILSTIADDATVYPCNGHIEYESHRPRPARPPRRSWPPPENNKTTSGPRWRWPTGAYRDVIGRGKGILPKRNISTPDPAFTERGPRTFLCEMWMLSCGAGAGRCGHQDVSWTPIPVSHDRRTRAGRCRGCRSSKTAGRRWSAMAPRATHLQRCWPSGN